MNDDERHDCCMLFRASWILLSQVEPCESKLRPVAFRNGTSIFYKTSAKGCFVCEDKFSETETTRQKLCDPQLRVEAQTQKSIAVDLRCEADERWQRSRDGYEPTLVDLELQATEQINVQQRKTDRSHCDSWFPFEALT